MIILRYLSLVRSIPFATAFLALLSPQAQGASRVSFPWLRDMQVTIYARKALSEDAALARLNLGVNVRDGIATVWGPVPSNDLSRKAVQKLEGVKGVLQVRSDLYLLGPRKEDEFPDLPFVFETPTQSESASPNFDSGTIQNLAATVYPGFPTETPASTLQASVSLLPPVAMAQGAKPGAAVVSQTRDLVTAAIERLRKADDRFRPITCEIKDGAVLLRPAQGRSEHVMAFAQAISQLPGVDRVVVLNPGQ